MPIRAKIRLNQEWAEFRVTYLHTNKQIDSSTIDGNVEFVHSHIQLYSYVTSTQFLRPTKLLTIVTILK